MLSVPQLDTYGETGHLPDDEVYFVRAKTSIATKQASAQRSPFAYNNLSNATTNDRRGSFNRRLSREERDAGLTTVTVDEYPLDWGCDFDAVDMDSFERVGGFAMVSVLDRRLVKLGIIAARAVLCARHADVLAPEVLLADLDPSLITTSVAACSSASSVLMIDEKQRMQTMGVLTAPVDDVQARRFLEDVIGHELHLDLAGYRAMSPAPVELFLVDPWETALCRQVGQVATQAFLSGTVPVPSSTSSANTSHPKELPPGLPRGPGHHPQQASPGAAAAGAGGGGAGNKPMFSMEEYDLRKLLGMPPLGAVLQKPDATMPQPERLVALISNSVHLMPCTFPIAVSTLEQFLTHRFRPEFVRIYFEPLCPTAFFAACPVGSKNAAKLASLHATLYLLNIVVPQCARSLDKEVNALGASDLIQRIHMFGINTRYLGWLLPFVRRPDVACAIITEITARAYRRVQIQRRKDREHRRQQRQAKMAEESAEEDRLPSRPSSATAEGDIQALGPEDQWAPPTAGPTAVYSSTASAAAPEVEDEVEDDEAIDFATLTRAAMNHFYPYHLRVPLPKFCESEMLFLRRLHPRYGIVIDALEAAGDSSSSSDGESKPQQEGKQKKPHKGKYEKNSRQNHTHVVPEIDCNVEFELSSMPPTPHEELGFEYHGIITPSLVDSAALEQRIIELCGKQSFIALPGKFHRLSVSSYINSSTSNGLTHFWALLHDALQRRAEYYEELKSRPSAVQASEGRRKVGRMAVGVPSPYRFTTGLLAPKPLDRRCSAPQLTPVLLMLAEVAYAIYPVEVSSRSQQSALYYLAENLLLCRRIRETQPPEPSGPALPLHQSEIEYRYISSLLLLGRYCTQVDRTEDASHAINEALQNVKHPRLHVRCILALLELQQARYMSTSESNCNFLGTDNSLALREHVDSMKPIAEQLIARLNHALPVGNYTREVLLKRLAQLILPAGGSSTASQQITRSGSVDLSSSQSQVSGPGAGGPSSPSKIAKVESTSQLRRIRNFASNGIDSGVELAMRRTQYISMDSAVPHFVSVSACPMINGGDEGGDGSTGTDAGVGGGLSKDSMTLVDCFVGNGRLGQKDWAEKRVLIFLGDCGKTAMACEIVKNILEERPLTSRSVRRVDADGLALQAPQPEGDDGGITSPTSPLTTKKSLRKTKSKGSSLWSRGSNNSSSGSNRGGANPQPSASLSQRQVPLCDYFPVCIDVAKHQPFDEDFLSRATGLHDHQLADLSLNPKVLLLVDNADLLFLGSGATWTSHRCFMTWSGKIIYFARQSTTSHLIKADFVQKITPPAPKSTRDQAPLSQAVRSLEEFLAASSAEGPPSSSNHLPLRDPEIAMASSLSIFGASTSSPSKAIITAASMASMTSIFRLNPLNRAEIRLLLQSFNHSAEPVPKYFPADAPKLQATHPVLQLSHHLSHTFPASFRELESSPDLLSILARCTPLASAANMTGDGFTTLADVMDVAIFWFLCKEREQKIRNEAFFYASSIAVRMTQDGTLTVPNDGNYSRYSHCLPLRLVSLAAPSLASSLASPLHKTAKRSNQEHVSFIHPVFRSYFLSSRALLELLDPDTIVFGSFYTSKLFTSALIAEVKQAATRRTGEAINALVLRGFTKSGSQSTVHKAVGKFKRSRKLALSGGEWLCTRDVGLDPDETTVALLVDRCFTIEEFRRTLRHFCFERRDHLTMLSNAATILSAAKVSFSGQSIKGADMSRVRLGEICACAVDARGSRWQSTIVHDVDFSFADFTAADFQWIDLGAATKIVRKETTTVLCVDFSPVDDLVATGDEFGAVAVYSVDTGLAKCRGSHGGPVASVAYSPSGAMIVTASADNTAYARVWQASSMALLAQLTGHSARLCGAYFCAEDMVVTAGHDWNVYTWFIHDIATGVAQQLRQKSTATADGAPADAKEAHSLTPKPRSHHSAAATSPAPAAALTPSPARCPVPKKEVTVERILRTTSPNNLLRTGSPGRTSPTPTRLAPLVPLATAAHEGPQNVREESRSSYLSHLGKRVAVTAPSSRLTSHKAAVTAISVHRDSKVVASASMDSVVRITNFHSRLQVCQFTLPDIKGPGCVVFSPDGSRVALPNLRGIAIFDCETGAIQRVIAYPDDTNDITSAMQFSRDGMYIAGALDSRMVLWGSAAGNVVFSTPRQQGRIASIGFSSLGAWVITSSWSGEVKLWPWAQLAKSASTAASKEKSASSGSVDASRSMEISSANQQRVVPSTKVYNGIHLISKGAHLACVTPVGQVDIFHAQTGKALGSCGAADMTETSISAGDLHSDFVAVGHTTVTLMTAFRRSPKMNLIGHVKPIISMVFLPRASAAHAGKYVPTFLATSGSDRSLRIWDCELRVLVSMSVLEYPFTGLCAGERILFAACGYLSSKSLTLNVLPFSALQPQPKEGGAVPLSPRSAAISGVGGRKAAKSTLETTRAHDMPLRIIRVLLLCIRTRRADKLRDPTGALAVRLLLPHLVQPYHHSITSSFGPMRVAVKEGSVRAAVGCADSIGVVTVERCVFVWDIPKRSLVYSCEVHASTITAVEVIGEHATRGGMVLTASLDGTIVLASCATGDKTLVIKPTRTHAMLSATASRLASATPRLIFGSSTDGTARAWSLAGAACVIGTQHSIACLSPPELQQWLATKGLGALTQNLSQMYGSELINQDSTQLNRLFGLTDEAVATILAMVPSAGAAAGGNKDAKRQSNAAALQRKLSGSSRLARGSSLSDSFLRAGVDPVVVGRGSITDVHLAAQIYQSVQKLNAEIVALRESAYDNISLSAYDDGVVSAEMITTFSIERLALFVSEQLGIRCFGPFVLFFKVSGSVLMNDPTVQGINALLGKSFHDLAKCLYDEMSLLRGKARDSFATKNAAEVAIWAKQKSQLVQFILGVLDAHGSQLTTKTNFIYQMTIQCSACNKPIPDASMSCVLGGDHSSIAPTEDFDTTIAMRKLISILQERFELATKDLVAAIAKVPSAHFSCGLNFYKLLKDTGFIAPVAFATVPRASHNQNLVIDSATITMTVTENDLPRMLCLGEHHPKLLQQMAGLSLKVGPCDRVGPSALPPGWEQIDTQKTTSAGTLSTRYAFGRHVQSEHPTMPEAYGVRSIGDAPPTMTTAFVSRLTPAEAREVGPPQQPKPQHFFSNAAGEQTYAAGWPTKSMTADVTDIVAASIERGEAAVSIFIVAQALPESETMIADAVRPQLQIRFHDPEKLCACGSSAPPSIPLTKLGSRSVSHSSTAFIADAPTALCDRFCNLETQCRGHQCGFDTSKCKKAPYLQWATSSPEGSSFQGVALTRIVHLSETNKAHMQERTGPPPEPPRVSVTAGVGSNTSLGGTLQSLDDRPFADNVDGRQGNAAGSVVNESFASAASSAPLGPSRAPGSTTRKPVTISFEQALQASGLQ